MQDENTRLILEFMGRLFGVGECWIWPKHLDEYGYGRVNWQGRFAKPHRVSYELFMGAIAEGLEIDHVCRNPSCVNPKHLEPVTHVENMRRARKTHCINGHELTPENTYPRKGGGRACRFCMNRAQRDYQRRKRLAAA